MKKLFVLLRQGNLEEVKKIIEAKPELLNCVAGPQPKKDHGQSLLQVALKSGNFDIADYLIDKGMLILWRPKMMIPGSEHLCCLTLFRQQ